MSAQILSNVDSIIAENVFSPPYFGHNTVEVNPDSTIRNAHWVMSIRKDLRVTAALLFTETGKYSESLQSWAVSRLVAEPEQINKLLGRLTQDEQIAVVAEFETVKNAMTNPEKAEAISAVVRNVAGRLKCTTAEASLTPSG